MSVSGFDRQKRNRFFGLLSGRAVSSGALPRVVLTLQNTPLSGEKKIRITKGKETFFISAARQMDTARFSFDITQEETDLLHFLEKVSPRVGLKGQADFAIGIVTGNNRKFIKKEFQPGGETILKGSHIFPYRIAPSPYTLVFQPELFQQSASAELYRPPRSFCIRFNSRYLDFAYDDRIPFL
jgi:hypothetical protein